MSQYVAGLVVSPNKTVQGIYDQQVDEWGKPSRRAMHEVIFEAGWDDEELMVQHRARVAEDDRGRGREVISLDSRAGASAAEAADLWGEVRLNGMDGSGW
ncbi:MAG: hypothetical protein RMM98_06285 [Acidobacteriota bacterium]|nr:hypothetical protein [Blastocatellia bacterium]MDW8239206.1 hypothetical protein [Acidobacteriota bacterium]